MKTINEIEAELAMKAQRVKYWEAFHRIPQNDELNIRGGW